MPPPCDYAIDAKLPEGPEDTYANLVSQEAPLENGPPQARYPELRKLVGSTPKITP